MGNLTPFDAEMMMMVESLTGKRPIDTRFDDHFMVHASYRNCKDEPEKISAIIDAVRGRLGERLTEVNDRPELSLVMFTIKYDETQYPTVDGFGDEARPELERGEMYIRYTEDSRTEKCWAIRVTRKNYITVAIFCGNGEMQIERRLNGKAQFTFLNNGVYVDVPENEYIFRREKGNAFEHCPAIEFEREWHKI